MLIVIDIGNSTVSIGVFSGAELIGKLRLQSCPARASGFYREKIYAFLSENKLEGCISGAVMSSVVPELTDVIEHAIKDLKLGAPLQINAFTETGLFMDIENPDEVGPDRIANAVAANAMFGDRVLVVDFGTATTISAVKDNKYIGGAILPGLGLMSEALHKGTSKLPYIVFNASPDSGYLKLQAFGKNTTKCISSGIIYGSAGAIERLISEMENEEACNFTIVITGGYSNIVRHFLKRDFHLIPDLTLKGLMLIYERYK